MDSLKKGDPVEPVLLSDYCTKAGQAVPVAYIVELTSRAASSIVLEHLGNKVKEAYARRLIVEECEEITNDALDQQTNFETIIKKGKTLFNNKLDKAQANASFTIRSVAELLKLPEETNANLLGEWYLQEGRPTALLGQGGLGKTRLAIQLAIVSVCGLPFLEWETFMKGKRWLFLQTENVNRRLKSDISGIVKAFELYEYNDEISNSIFFHTIENEFDPFFNFSNTQDILTLQQAINDTKADIIVIDPLNDKFDGDTNSDADMRALITSILKACLYGNPKRSILLLHHARTGKSGASGAIGLDRASFGRGSKALHAAARSIWNFAPADENDPAKFVLACGKNSDGKEFEPIGIKFKDGAYWTDKEFDIQTFKEQLGIVSQTKPSPTQYVTKAINAGYSKKTDIINYLTQEMGLSKSTAYRYVETALSSSKFYQKADEIKIL
jgi:hypothetical protein